MCLSPFRATRDFDIVDKGSLKIREKYGKIRLCHEGELLLPCGKCDECIKKRAFDWATRCKHEISQHAENCFITLTYDEENIKNINPFHFKREFQLFMKRLRKQEKEKIRYIVSHEYGGKTGRPHHHAILFNYNPSNQYHFTNSPKGEKLYRSEELEKLWTNGISSIGEANEKTSFYIATYALKSGSTSAVHPDSGEIVTLRDSMDSSKRPAIGKNYLIKNADQLLTSGSMMPRYYLKLIEKQLEEDLAPEKRFMTINHADKLLQEYENSIKILKRTPHEIYAKHIINKQKQEMEEKGLRSDIDRATLAHTTNHLKASRNDSDAIFRSERKKL